MSTLRNGRTNVPSLLLTLLAGWYSLGPAIAQTPRKFAFVVGVSHYYKDGLDDLQFAHRDAEDLAGELSKQHFNVVKLTGEQASRQAVMDAWLRFLATCQALGKHDVVLVSFSGHGVQKDIIVSNGDSKQKVETPFFCVYDSLKTDVETMINLNSILKDLEERSGSSNNLLLVDACRDNPDKGAKTLDGSTVKELPTKISILFSSSPGMKSYESEEVEHGIFTHVLLAGLRGDARNSRGEVDWLRLAAHVVSEVPILAPRLLADSTAIQRPNLVGNSVSSPIIASKNLEFEKKLADARRFVFHFRDFPVADQMISSLRREGVDSPELDFLDAVCQLETEHYAAAEYLANKLQRQHPDSVYAHLSAIVAASKPGFDHHTPWNVAMTRAEIKRLEEHIMAAVRLAPDYEGTIDYAYHMWTVKPAQLNDYLDGCIERNPKHAFAIYSKGWVAPGGDEEAMQLFKRAHELDSGSPVILQAIGHRYVHLRDNEQALKYMEKASSLSPGFGWTRIDRIRTLIQLKEKKKAEEAIAEYESSVEPTYTGLTDIADAWQRLGNEDEAIRWYRKAITRDPGRRSAYASLAEIYVNADKGSELKNLINEFVQKCASQAEAHYLKARIYFQIQSVEDAAAEIRLAIKHSETPSVDILCASATYEALLGNLQESLSSLKAAAKIDRKLQPKLEFVATNLAQTGSVSVHNREKQNGLIVHLRSSKDRIMLNTGSRMEVKTVPYLGDSTYWSVTPEEPLQPYVLYHGGYKNLLGKDVWRGASASDGQLRFRYGTNSEGRTSWYTE